MTHRPVTPSPNSIRFSFAVDSIDRRTAVRCSTVCSSELMRELIKLRKEAFNDLAEDLNVNFRISEIMKVGEQPIDEYFKTLESVWQSRVDKY